MYDISHLSGRKCLILLEENPSSVFDIYLSEKVVILCENKTIRLTSIHSDRSIVSTETEFLDIANPFDIVAEFS